MELSGASLSPGLYRVNGLDQGSGEIVVIGGIFFIPVYGWVSICSMIEPHTTDRGGPLLGWADICRLGLVCDASYMGMRLTT